MPSDESQQVFQIGRVISTAVGTISRNLPAFAALTLLFSGLPTGVMYWAFGGVPGSQGFAVGWPLAVAWLLSMLGGALLQASMIRMTITDLNGARATVGEALATALQVFLPVIGLTLIIVVAATAGMVLLIVPGIIVYLMWSVAVPVLVEERVGIGSSLSRSRFLTKGARWKLFGLLAITMIALFIVQMLAGFISGLIGSPDNGSPLIAVIVINFATSMIFSMFFAAMLAVVYVELRRTKEGVSIDQLAEVFA